MSTLKRTLTLRDLILIVIGTVIQRRIAAGFTALTTRPGGAITVKGRKLPSLIG